MTDPVIDEFFADRKAKWLKSEEKANMSEVEKEALHRKADERFALSNWLPDAAKRVKSISRSTHPCTLSHPGARKNKNGYVTPILSKPPRNDDGYLKSGSVATEIDVLGNAGAMDIIKFLLLETSDGRTVLEHIQTDTALANELLNIPGNDCDTLKSQFAAVDPPVSNVVITSSRLKQVYFPVNREYHLLSILTNSGIVFELKNRLDWLRFSDEQRELRELRRGNEFSELGYKEILGITRIRYGGTKPQNVSKLNSENGGMADLLASVPPHLSKQEVRFPKKDFFRESIRYHDCREPLSKLHLILRSGSDSELPRRNLVSGRDRRIEDILDQIISRMHTVRNVAKIQFRPEISDLPNPQKIWLCMEFEERRDKENVWLDELCERITRWILDAYKFITRKPIDLGKAEFDYVHEFVARNREWLR